MQSILTKEEREKLSGRPRKRRKVRGRKSFVMNMCATRPGDLAKMRTLDSFVSKLYAQVERYGFTTQDERRIQRTISALRGLMMEYKVTKRQRGRARKVA